MPDTGNPSLEYPSTPATTIKPIDAENQNDAAPAHSRTPNPPQQPVRDDNPE